MGIRHDSDAINNYTKKGGAFEGASRITIFETEFITGVGLINTA